MQSAIVTVTEKFLGAVDMGYIANFGRALVCAAVFIMPTTKADAVIVGTLDAIGDYALNGTPPEAPGDDPTLIGLGVSGF